MDPFFLNLDDAMHYSDWPPSDNFTAISFLSADAAPQNQKKFLKAVENIINKQALCTNSLEILQLKSHLYSPSEYILKDNNLVVGYYHLFCHCHSADIEKAINFFYENLKTHRPNVISEDTLKSKLTTASKIGKIATSCFCLLPKDLQNKIKKIHSLIQNHENKDPTEAHIFAFALKTFAHLDCTVMLPSLESLTSKTKASSDSIFFNGTRSLRSSSEAIPIPRVKKKEFKEFFLFEKSPSFVNSMQSPPQHQSLSMHFKEDTAKKWHFSPSSDIIPPSRMLFYQSEENEKINPRYY